MSVVVEDLVKNYHGYKALDSISFHAEKGKILGFLGPNGAGKSTTMKIITGFLPPNSGKVRVNGMDINTHSLETRKMIGYLPENNPLYLDMYISEFLSFVGSIFKLSYRSRKAKVTEVMGLTGLEAMQKKKIGQLSKGYRQRVGLAQSLMGDPSVLILDEPTSGLDPNQLVEIRNLIVRLGIEKTIIFSTHILQEVENICHHIVILNQGKIVANDSVETLLKNSTSSCIYEVEFDACLDKSDFSSIDAIKEITPGIRVGSTDSKTYSYMLVCATMEDIRPRLFDLAIKKNCSLIGLVKKEINLEEIFHKLTQQQVSGVNHANQNKIL